MCAYLYKHTCIYVFICIYMNTFIGGFILLMMPSLHNTHIHTYVCVYIYILLCICIKIFIFQNASYRLSFSELHNYPAHRLNDLLKFTLSK